MKIIELLLALILALSIVSCNSSSNVNKPLLKISFNDIKTFKFSWSDTQASFYKLLEDPNGISGFSQIGENISGGRTTFNLPVILYKRINARYKVSSCKDASTCVQSDPVSIDAADLVGGIGYFKASNTGRGDEFGASVSLSDDGSTLAVGATSEDSNATSINQDEDDNSAFGSGAVYVFIYTEAGWAQEAYIKASNTGLSDMFGYSLSLSDDGNTLAVGATSEDSNVTGIDGEDNDSASFSGAVYVFTRREEVWAQEAYIKASNTGVGDGFGISLDLSTDGNTLVVGAVGEASSQTGVDGDQDDNSANNSGAVYVFTRREEVWAQEAYIKASNTNMSDGFGFHLSLSSDGNTLAVGANREDSDATGVDGDQGDNSANNSGAVYVFARREEVWAQEAYIKASNTGGNDEFGTSISLSSDGNTLAVGAINESSDATGVDGDQGDNSANNSGAVYVFARREEVWAQEAYIKASNTEEDDRFGTSISLSSDGNTLVVGAINESSNATGVDGEDNNLASGSGAVYVFTRREEVWAQEAYIKASNTGGNDEFGTSISLSSDGSTLAVGAINESSNATGVNGDQGDNSANNSGAVYLY